MITDHLLKRNILEYISRRRRVFWKVRLLFSVYSPGVSIVYTYQVLFCLSFFSLIRESQA